MALLQSAAQKARQLYDEFQKRNQPQKKMGLIPRVVQQPQVQNFLNAKPIPGQQRSINQVAQDVRTNPSKFILSSALTTGQARTGIRPVDKYVARPTGQALNSFINTSSLGLVNPPGAPARTTPEKAGQMFGIGVGLVNPYNLAAKGLAPLGSMAARGIGSKLAGKVAGRTIPQLARRALPAVGSELAQTAALGSAKGALGQEFNPLEDFGAGIGLRGLLRVPGARGIYRRPHSDDARMLDQAVDTLRGKGSKSIDVVRARRDLNALLNTYARERIPQGEYQKLLKGGNLNKQISTLQSLLRNADQPNLRMSLTADSPISKDLITKVKKGGAKSLTPEELKEVSSLPVERYRELLNNKPEGFFQKADQAAFNTGKTPSYMNSFVQPQSTKEILNDTDQYLKELVQRQKSASSSGPAGKLQGGRDFLAKIKSQIVDSVSPIEDALSNAEKKGKFKVLPKQDVRLQIDRVLRSRTLASQFAEDNGFVEVIKKAPNLDALDQYMIAKQASRVSELGKATGRDPVRDAKLIEDLAPEYEQYAQTVNQYSRKILDYSVNTGLIDKKLANELVRKYPDYVPLQRVFSELEKGTPYKGTTKAVASISKQGVVQKLEGSEREIASPIESLLLKTQTAFEQGEKNKAARMLGSYSNLPGFEKLIRPLKGDQSAAHTISYLENGTKRTFETTPEIAAAAKNLNQEQMNIVLKVLSVPTRILQLGATGLNVPFVVTNVAKDQVTAFVNSNKAASTSLLNPINFGRALFSAVKHDDLYDEVIRNAAGGTTFDIARQAPELSVARLRSSKNLGSKIAFTAKNPGDILRALENIVGRGEEVTRVQQYRGTYQALIKEGRTPEDARLLAAQAARSNTVNFARKGDIGKVFNYIIPFFNAGIQGARTFVRNVQTRPVETGAKVSVAVFMPIAASTAWNLSDPERKKVYEDIDEFEKASNIIIIPDNATQDDKGRWNVIKIPLPPGLSNLGSLVRRPMEQVNGLDPVKFEEIANNLFSAGTSLDFSSTNKVASTFTPQAVKPFIEGYTNTNLFTGKPIVPDSLKDLPIKEQARPYTSGTARLIGRQLNVAPLKVENFAGTAAGGLGRQLLNASDTALNKAGQIPEEQIGGENPLENIQKRFTKASGGYIDEKGAKDVTEIKEKSALESYQRKQKAITLYAELKKLPKEQANQKALDLKKKDKLLFKALKTQVENEKLGLTYREKVIKDLTVEDYSRAKYVAQEFKKLKTKDEKNALYKDWKKKKIISEDVLKQLKAMKKKGEL